MLILTLRELGGLMGVDVVGWVILMLGGGDEVMGDELLFMWISYGYDRLPLDGTLMLCLCGLE